ncbi:MAG TPA: hypothetical protein PK256_04910 [Verrucomicrobiota bacterium]|nr:hypothetical protein [Verrucomicrobiota bacterium]
MMRRRIDRIGLFREELAELERERALILAPEQRSHLDRHLDRLLSDFRKTYGVDSAEKARRASWGMKITALLGGSALIAAAVLFLHRIWGHLPMAIQVGMLTIIPLGVLATAALAFARQADRYYVGLLSLAAGAVFVIEINALGSVLNLGDSPGALLGWGLFGVLVAYAHGLRLLLGAGLGLLCIYTAALTMSLQGYNWSEFPMKSQMLIPGAVVLYVIPWWTRRKGNRDFDSVYRLCGAAIGLWALLMVSTLGDLCCGKIRPNVIAAVYQVLGIGLSAGVVCHGLQLSQRGLVNLGAGGFIIFLFVRLHAWWWQWMPKYLFFLMIALIAIGLLLVLRRLQTGPEKGARR